MREFKRLSLRPDPDQPRKPCDDAELLALAERMLRDTGAAPNEDTCEGPNEPSEEPHE
jgi:hypothetical protein